MQQTKVTKHFGENSVAKDTEITKRKQAAENWNTQSNSTVSNSVIYCIQKRWSGCKLNKIKEQNSEWKKKIETFLIFSIKGKKHAEKDMNGHLHQSFHLEVQG